MVDVGLGTLLAGVIGGSMNLLGSAFNINAQNQANEINKDIAQQNIDFQREAQNMNLELTRESWARNDSEIQRRVKDAVKAGINPLAVLGGASTSAPIAVSPLHNDYEHKAVNTGNTLFSAVQALQMSQDFAFKDAQIANLAKDAQVKDTYVNGNRASYGSKIVDTLDSIRTMYNSGFIGKEKYGKIINEFANMFGISSGTIDEKYSEILARALRYSVGPLFEDNISGFPDESLTNNLDLSTVDKLGKLTKYLFKIKQWF